MYSTMFFAEEIEWRCHWLWYNEYLVCRIDETYGEGSILVFFASLFDFYSFSRVCYNEN